MTLYKISFSNKSEDAIIGTTLSVVSFKEFADMFYETMKLPQYNRKSLNKQIEFSFNLAKDFFHYTDEVTLFKPKRINYDL